MLNIVEFFHIFVTKHAGKTTIQIVGSEITPPPNNFPKNNFQKIFSFFMQRLPLLHYAGQIPIEETAASNQPAKR